MTGNNRLKQASKEATDWLILLNDDPGDAARRRAFEAWLEKSPANAAAWDAMQQASKAMDKATPVYAGRWQPALAELRTKTKREAAPSVPLNHRHAANRIKRRRITCFGAAALAACLLAAVTGPDLLLGWQADYTTGTAETRTIHLPDDSTVTLAPESAVTVAYTSDQRRIRLLSGAGFFDVIPNAERPFEITAKTLDVTVLGTRFDLRRGEDGAEIAVAHGEVRIAPRRNAGPPLAETLVAGEAIRMSWTGQAERRTIPPDQVASWRNEELIARDAPLGRVVDRLRPYYTGRIMITDAALSARPVTGVYNLADPLAALSAIARAQNATLRRVTPWLIIISGP